MRTLLNILLAILLTTATSPRVAASQEVWAEAEEVCYKEEFAVETQEQEETEEDAPNIQPTPQFKEDYLEFDYSNDEGLYSRRFRLSQEERLIPAPVAVLSDTLPVSVYAYFSETFDFSENYHSRGYLSGWYPILFRYRLF